MRVDEFEALLEDFLPDDFTLWFHEDGGEIVLHTRLKFVEGEDGEGYVFPMEKDIPDNVINFADHPIVLAAHHREEIKEMLSPTDF